MTETDFKFLSPERRRAQRLAEIDSEGASLEAQLVALQRQSDDLEVMRGRIREGRDKLVVEKAELEGEIRSAEQAQQPAETPPAPPAPQG